MFRTSGLPTDRAADETVAAFEWIYAALAQPDASLNRGLMLRIIVGNYNDTHTYEQVRSTLDRAIELAETSK